jgi:hypothetical protein
MPTDCVAMPTQVEADMKWSAKLFQSEVWPLIQKHLGNGKLLQMEGRPDTELARTLDMLAGIDGWHIHSHGMRGIASRVQETDKSWDTFTVRMARDSGAVTEFEKRRLAISESNRGWIYPALTVQAYAKTKNGPVFSCGIARTKDIIEFIERDLHEHPLKRTTNACFAVCIWEKMQFFDYDVRIIKPDAATPGLRLVRGNLKTTSPMP